MDEVVSIADSVENNIAPKPITEAVNGSSHAAETTETEPEPATADDAPLPTADLSVKKINSVVDIADANSSDNNLDEDEEEPASKPSECVVSPKKDVVVVTPDSPKSDIVKEAVVDPVEPTVKVSDNGETKSNDVENDFVSVESHKNDVGNNSNSTIDDPFADIADAPAGTKEKHDGEVEHLGEKIDETEYVVHTLSDTEDESDDDEESVSNNSNNQKELEKIDIDDDMSSQSASKVQEIEDDDDPIPLSDDSELDEEDDEDNSHSKRNRSVEKTLEKSLEPLPKKLKPTTNGSESPDIEEILSDKEDVIVIDEQDPNELTPRRSNRQRKSIVKVRDFAAFDDDNDDVEEIPDDPLSAPSKQKINFGAANLSISSPVNLDIQQQIRQQAEQFKKNKAQQEPTLVMIDTNTLLANRNSNKSLLITQQQSNMNHTQKGGNQFAKQMSGSPAQNMYNINMRTTISPVTSKSQVTAQLPALLPVSQPSILLPALSDDMFVLEAPSFIVPYIYEKPPPEDLRDVVTKINALLEEIRQKRKQAKEDELSEELANKTVDETVIANLTTAEKKKLAKHKKKRYNDNDDSWDENDTSTDEEASDSEDRTKVLIKDVRNDIDSIKEHIITPDSIKQQNANATPVAKKSENYFESPVGKFFMNIGIDLVQEYVQTDLLRQQKRKRDREGKRHEPNPSTQMAINSLMKNLELNKENTKPFKFEMKRCEYCPFKSESSLAMAHHYEMPHLNNQLYKCNFCAYETRPPHDILYHMEAIHNTKGRIEKTLSYHQCPNCTFEDNGKSKLARHALACVKKFKPESNLAPFDWDPPGKLLRMKSKHGLIGTANAYQAIAAQQAAQRQALATAAAVAAANATPVRNINPVALAKQRSRAGGAQSLGKAITTSVLQGQMAGGFKQSPQNMRWQMDNNNRQSFNQINQQVLQQMARGGGNLSMLPNQGSLSIQANHQFPGPKSSKISQQPSISITPLPRGGGNQSSPMGSTEVGGPVTKLPSGVAPNMKPGQNPNATSKTSFVICEICDGYIKDLDQLRNHMQWIHKVKIHPKMIYNRPPLNCQKCQFRFFTDQGLERHLLGSHGLVTSSMQEAANKGKDAGRCPICGRVYQWKLLNHVSRDHNMTLKPAHLSYKCTVCTATFGMYKQFESHVYSAHSTVAKKAMDAKKTAATSTSRSGDSLLKPLKINDEITIIPQPATNKSRHSGMKMEMESHVID